MHNREAGDSARSGHWSARGRQFGVGVLIAFTLKGICTSAVIVTALFAVRDEGGADLFPHLLVWTVVCIGGFCMLGGWRHTRRRGAEELLKRID